MKQASRGAAVATAVIMAVLALYTAVTLCPFYFLFVRSFVPTVESTRFHAWIPPQQEFDLNARFGNMATFYNLDVAKFKRTMGITGFMNMNLTVRQIAEQYGIPEARMKEYFQPFYLFNGWYIVLHSAQFYRSFVATVGVTAVSIILGTLLGSATGLGLSHFRRRWQSMVYTLYLLQMVIPMALTMLPSYMIVRALRLTNTYLVLVFGAISGGALSTMIFTSAATAIPTEIRESLKVDGGGMLTYYWDILLPLIKPAIGTYSLIMLPQVWNSLMGSLLYNKPEKYLLMAFINALAGTYATNYQAIYAGLMMSVLPLLVVYVLFQRLFVRAALAGAIKG